MTRMPKLLAARIQNEESPKKIKELLSQYVEIHLEN